VAEILRTAPRAGGSRRPIRLAMWAWCLAAAGCVAGVWGLDALERDNPGLSAISGHRLGDVTPYLLPSSGEVAFFLCRWPTEEPIPVSLPPDADADERRGLEAVMRAWEESGLGIRFEKAAAPGRGIEVRFFAPKKDTTESVYAANTVADCAVDAEVFDSPIPPVIPARIVSASILMWRGGFDAIGRAVPHSSGEFLGSALHEFGHALGFQGHVKVGGSIMVAEKDVVRRAGQRLESGRPFEDATLRALYAVASGSVLHRESVALTRTRTVDRMAEIAAADALAGPFLRVGDFDAFVVWRGIGGPDYRVKIRNVRKLMHRMDSFDVRPAPRTRELLELNPPMDPVLAPE